MKKLTDEQKKDYVDNFGTCCPYCDSDDIMGEDWEFGAGEVWQDIRCGECGKVWTDIYSITGIEEKEE